MVETQEVCEPILLKHIYAGQHMIRYIRLYNLLDYIFPFSLYLRIGPVVIYFVYAYRALQQNDKSSRICAMRTSCYGTQVRAC
jgi:hypothetical protein